MIDVLAAIGSVGTLGLGAAVVVLALRYVSLSREMLAARDLLDKTREELRTVRGELEVEIAAHKVTRDLLAKEQDLRAVVESQRNQAWRDARDEIVERIKNADIADAARLVADLLAAPLPGVPEAVPAAAAPARGSAIDTLL